MPSFIATVEIVRTFTISHQVQLTSCCPQCAKDDVKAMDFSDVRPSPSDVEHVTVDAVEVRRI